MEHEEKLIKQLNIPAKLCKLNINNINLSYLVAGKGDPLILLHGAGIGWGQWYKNIPYLSKYFKVYAIDLPGSGGSTRIDYSIINFNKHVIDTLNGFIEKLKIKNPHIIGHSIGAWIALKLVESKQNSRIKLVLTNPLGLTDKMPINQLPLAIPYVAKLITKTVMKPTKKNIQIFLESVLHNKNVVDKAFVDYVHEGVNRGVINHPLLLISRIAGIPRVKKDFVFIEEFKKIENSILVIGGEYDPIVNFKQLKESSKLNKYSKMKVFFDVGHVIPIESTNLFNKSVRDFLMSKEPGPH